MGYYRKGDITKGDRNAVPRSSDSGARNFAAENVQRFTVEGKENVSTFNCPRFILDRGPILIERAEIRGRKSPEVARG